MYSRSFVTSSSVRSRTFVSSDRPSALQTPPRAFDRPMPKMYVRPTSSRFSRGRFTLAIRAKSPPAS